MKIGIISDSHDNETNLVKAINKLKELNIQEIIHCGDYCAPTILKMLDLFNLKIHCIFGNVDGDKFQMAKLSFTELKNISLYGELAEITIDSVKIAMHHNPGIAFALALTKKYDLVCYGHSHIQDKKLIDKCLLVNPGAINGKENAINFAVFDTKSKEIEFYKI